MRVYVEKIKETVEVPDDFTDEEIKGLNDYDFSKAQVTDDEICRRLW